MPSIPDLSPDAFRLTRAFALPKDRTELNAVGAALLDAAGLKGRTVSVTGPSAFRPRLPAKLLLGLTVLGIKKNKNRHEVEFVFGLFDAKSKAPVAWSQGLDPKGSPGRNKLTSADPAGSFLFDAADLARIKEVASGKPAGRPSATAKSAFLHPATIVNLAIGRDGSLCTLALDGALRVFDGSGNVMQAVKTGSTPKALARHGTLAATGLKKVLVFDTSSGEKRLTLEGHPRGEVRSVAFSRSGKLLATASAIYQRGGERQVALWDESGGNVARLTLTDAPCFVAFSQDERAVLAVCTRFEGDAVLLFDVRKGQPAGEFRWGTPADIEAVAASADTLFVRRSQSVDAVDMKTLAVRSIEVPAVPMGMGPGCFAVSPDAKTLLLKHCVAEKGKWVQSVLLASARDGRELHRFKLPGGEAPTHGSFEPEGKWFAVAGEKQIWRFDLDGAPLA